MPVEQYQVSLGLSSPYDNISAVIRGRTVPENGQSFTMNLDEVGIRFEIEDVNEKIRGAAESLYNVTGRELRSEYLYRAVDCYVTMREIDGLFGMPTALSILQAAGLTVVYDAPEFHPAQAAMGWKSYGFGTVRKIRVREKNVQILLQKLFDWSADFGKRRICYHVRAGVLYVWELQRSTGQSLALTEAMCPDDALAISRKRIRKFTEATDTSGETVTTPVSAITISYQYNDVPYSGSIPWGDAMKTYSNGLLISDVSTGKTETLAYGVAYGANVLIKKTTLSATKRTETSYEYGNSQEGATLGTGRNDPVLSKETTRSWTIEDGDETEDPEMTIITHHSRGDGFYGQTAVRYIDGDVDQVQHGVSKSSPMGAASQYTQRRLAGFVASGGSGSGAQAIGYLLAQTRIPIEDTDLANDYLDEFIDLHGAIESKLTATVIGQAALNPIQGKIIFRGIEYYVTDVSVAQTPKERRMSLSGTRWDYDLAYRRDILGVEE